jgi:hypothetical protein
VWYSVYSVLTLDFTTGGEVKVTQDGYVTQLLDECGIDGTASSPAAEDIFDTDNDLPLCDTKETFHRQTAFHLHRQTARLLYLGKRTKPEILLAVSYLTTRVNKCNASDVRNWSACLSMSEETDTEASSSESEQGE